MSQPSSSSEPLSTPPRGEALAEPRRTESEAWFRRVTFFGLLASACPLIPIPFLDDWALDWVRKRLVVETYRRRGLEPNDIAVRTLVGETERSWAKGCLLWVLWLPIKLTLVVLKKLIRKLVIFLLIKDCTDRFSETFHEGYLLNFALAQGYLQPGATIEEPYGALRSRRATRRACQRIDASPIRQLAVRTLKGSRRLLLETARVLGHTLRKMRSTLPGGMGSEKAPTETVVGSRAPIEEEERLLAGVLDRLTADLWHQEGYLGHLEALFTNAFWEEEPPRDTPAGEAT